MILRTICNSGGRILRLSSLMPNNSNYTLTLMSSAGGQSHLRNFSDTCDEDKQNSSASGRQCILKAHLRDFSITCDEVEQKSSAAGGQCILMKAHLHDFSITYDEDEPNLSAAGGQRILMKAHIRNFSIPCDEDEQKLSTVQKEQEPPRNAYVKIDVITRMSELVFYYMRDKNVSVTTALEMFTKEKAHKYILLVFRNCHTSHVLEVRRKLSYAGISELQFSQAISKIFFTLELEPDSNLVFANKRYGRDEIIKIFDHLKLNDVEYDCVRILLSLKEKEFYDPNLWAI